MQLYDFKEIEERVILIGVQTEQDEDVAASLDELEELAFTAGAVTVGKVIQNREAVHPGTYIGKGKIEEVAALLAAYDANGIICDDELSPAQMNNLERELDCKVMDRTLLILDIFRMLSKNHSARYAENQKYLQLTAKFRYWLDQQKKLWQERKYHHIYTCPKCKQKIRIPKGKGKIMVRCPKCHFEFQKRS